MKQLNKFINDQKQAQENRIKLARAEEVIKTPVPLVCPPQPLLYPPFCSGCTYRLHLMENGLMVTVHRH
jgi:hypothetical protein